MSVRLVACPGRGEREQLEQEVLRGPGNAQLVGGLAVDVLERGEGVEDPAAAAIGEPPRPEPQQVFDRVLQVGGAAAHPVGVTSPHVIDHRVQ